VVGRHAVTGAKVAFCPTLDTRPQSHASAVLNGAFAALRWVILCQMSVVVGDAVAQRITGEQPSRARAIAAAVIVALGAGFLAYKALRSGAPRKDGDDRGESSATDEAAE
jgi:hypothetical protein